jgi:hypothetical protein
MTMLPEVQMWAAIISSELMEGPYPESVFFLFGLLSLKSLC